MSTASAVCAVEGVIDYSAHGTDGQQHTFFYIIPNAGVANAPSNIHWRVEVDWGGVTPACAGLGHNQTQVGWGLTAQGNKQRVRVIGNAATCPTAGNIRSIGCFLGANIF
jgi:hypothetical protein